MNAQCKTKGSFSVAVLPSKQWLIKLGISYKSISNNSFLTFSNINDLEHDNKCCHIILRSDAWCSGTQSCESFGSNYTIYNYVIFVITQSFWQQTFRYFRLTKTVFDMVVSIVIQSQIYIFFVCFPVENYFFPPSSKPQLPMLEESDDQIYFFFFTV